MSSLLSLGFEFNGSHYSFLARVKEDREKTEYHITVMDEKLKKLLHGNDIITFSNGHSFLNLPENAGDGQTLRKQIAGAIAKYINEKSLTSY